MTNDPPDDTGNVRTLGTPKVVLGAIEERILRDRLRAGDRLPPEHDLARSLGVGVARVREALRVLESVGVLDAAPAGSARTVSAQPAPALGGLVRLCAALSLFHTTDLMTTRLELERSAAAGAAANATPADLARLRGIVAAMRDPDVTRAEFGALDCDFHQGMARAAHNDLTAGLLDALHDAIRTAMTAVHATIADWPATRTRLAAEHANILAALETGDPAAATDRLATHIATYYHLPA